MIILTVVSTSCQHGAPAPPNLPLYQPVINSPAVDPNGQPIVLNYCAKWVYDENNDKWNLSGKSPAEKCSGIFGLDTDGRNKALDYQRELTDWIGENCGDKKKKNQIQWDKE